MIKNLVYLAILTSVIALSWVGFGIYHNYTSSTISSDTNILITPIPSHFDLAVVKNLSDRKVVAADLTKKTVTASPSAQPTPTIILLKQPKPTPQVPVVPSVPASPPSLPLNNSSGSAGL